MAGIKHISLFLGGVLFGTAGLNILASKDAKKVYAHTTAAALRAKDCLMEKQVKLQENAEDILAEAKLINEEREEEVYDEEDFAPAKKPARKTTAKKTTAKKSTRKTAKK